METIETQKKQTKPKKVVEIVDNIELKEKAISLIKSNDEEMKMLGTELGKSKNLSYKDREEIVNVFNDLFLNGDQDLTVEMINNVYLIKKSYVERKDLKGGESKEIEGEKE